MLVKTYSQILSTIKLTEKFEVLMIKIIVIVCSSYPQETSTIQRCKFFEKKVLKIPKSYWG